MNYEEKLKQILGIEEDSQLDEFTISAKMAINIYKQLQKKNMQIPVVDKSNHKHSLPSFMTPGSAGVDLRSDINITMLPNQRVLIPTGLYVALPVGYEAQIRPRSGLAMKGITVLNSPGTIDADYRGEIKVLLISHSQDAYTIEKGDRIAQMVVSKVEQFKWDPVLSLDTTARAEGGFGHTGRK